MIVMPNGTTRDERRRAYRSIRASERAVDVFALTKGQRIEVADLAVGYVYDAYESSQGLSEPAITVAEIADYIAQHSRCPEPIRGVPRRIYLATLNAVRQAVRRGRLATSLGCTRHSSREVRLYEPHRMAR